MSRRIAPELSLARKALLTVTGAVALAVPVLAGVLNVPIIRAQSQPRPGPKAEAPPSPQMIAQQTRPASPPAPSVPARPAGKAAAQPQPAEERLAFEVATIKLARPDAAPMNQVLRVSPTRIEIPSMTLTALIYAAYGEGGLNTSMRVTGGPDWAKKTAYSIEGLAAATATPQQQRLMLQSLLVERFALKIRNEEETNDVLALTVDRRDRALGPKVRKWDGTCPGVMPALYFQAPRRSLQRVGEKFVPGPASETDDSDVPYCPTGYRAAGGIRIDGATMRTVAEMLSLPPARALLGTITQDRTGLIERYTMELDFPFTPPSPAAISEFAGQSLSDAVREQWGLRLVRSKGQLRVILIDSAQPPTEN